MTKPKQILQGEEFIIEGYYWSYSLVDNKVKFSVLRKASDKKPKGFIAPTIYDVGAYFQEKGYTNEAAKKFFDYYDAAEWKDGKGNQVKNWRQKAIGVWFKDENKIKETTTKTEMVR